MKRAWIILALALIGLAFLVPISSRRPDPIQHILGQAGGVESSARAVYGIGVALVAAMAVAWILARKNSPKP